MPVSVIRHKGKNAFEFNGRQHFESDFGLPLTMSGNAPYTLFACVASSGGTNENECIIDLNESYGELSKIILGYGRSPRSGITMHYGWYEDMGLDIFPPEGEWTNIVVTFDGYKEKIYINGAFVKEKDIFINVGECRTMTLGVKSDGEHPFSGYLHSLKLFDVAIDEKKIISNNF
jgi:hypothetical protein